MRGSPGGSICDLTRCSAYENKNTAEITCQLLGCSGARALRKAKSLEEQMVFLGKAAHVFKKLGGLCVNLHK